MMSTPTYSKSQPFLASIKERYSLCRSGSKKNTQHIVLNLKGSGITYNVGDSIAVFPQNDPQLIERTIQAMKASGSEIITDKRSQKPYTLRDFLTYQANITDVHHKIVADISAQTNNTQEALPLWEVLEACSSTLLSPQKICDLLQPLLPRFYSIASSSSAAKEEIHLTVALLRYETNGNERLGVCTHYLCNLAPLGSAVVPVYIQPHHGFTLPSSHDTPIVMIGPGTGVAPYRAFMQERMAKNATGKHWLFFGEWNRATDFFYEEYWNGLVSQNRLRLETAFSRDQPEKIYVQHRMLEHGAELYHWIEGGAHLYVCGDAKRMAKDVEATLLQIILTHGKHDEPSAKQYLKRLRTEKRYLRDVY